MSGLYIAAWFLLPSQSSANRSVRCPGNYGFLKTSKRAMHARQAMGESSSLSGIEDIGWSAVCTPRSIIATQQRPKKRNFSVGRTKRRRIAPSRFVSPRRYVSAFFCARRYNAAAQASFLICRRLGALLILPDRGGVRICSGNVTLADPIKYQSV